MTTFSAIELYNYAVLVLLPQKLIKQPQNYILISIFLLNFPIRLCTSRLDDKIFIMAANKSFSHFNDQCLSHIETSQLICRANHINGFYMTGKLVVKGLNPFLADSPIRSSHRRSTIKKDSGTGVFLWTLRNFQEHFFYRTPPDDCFCPILHPLKTIENQKFFWSFHEYKMGTLVRTS